MDIQNRLSKLKASTTNECFSKMKEQLISNEDIRKLHPVFEKKNGENYIKISRKVTGLDIACEVYDNSKHLVGVEFTTDLLDKLGIERNVINGHILEQYKDQPFITVSNHHNGHVDGIALIETVASRVENFKVMVNFILGFVDTMEDNFITVNPYKESDKKHISLSGIKESIAHIKEGHPLGFFPAGSVSRLKLRKGKFDIVDREWQESVVKLIAKSKVPVIPIHIDFRNSYPFYASRFIHWTLQTMALCHELKNKDGKTMTITIGDPIMPEEIKLFKKMDKLGNFLKEKTYALAKKG